MLTIIVAVLLIVVGALWSLATWLVLGMASKRLSLSWNEIPRWAFWGLAPVTLGVALLIWS